MGKAGSALGRLIMWLLVIVLIILVAAVALFFVLRSQGMTYYVEYGGERYFFGSDGGGVNLYWGIENKFSVKSLTGGEVNYTVKITSNKANNLMFTVGDELWYLWNDNAEKDDYTEVFGLQKQTDGFSLTIPEDFTVEKAIETKYGGDITLMDELSDSTAYFVITVSCDKNSVDLWFVFGAEVAGLIFDSPQIIF